MVDGTSQSGGSGNNSVPQCGSNTLFGPAPHGNSGCVKQGDIVHKRPKDDCHCGNPIFPLTGVKKQDESLGVTIGRHPLVMTYDTTFDIPTTDGSTNIAASPPPSFGAQWHSSVHKLTMLQPAQAAPLWGFSSELSFRGSKGWDSLAANSSNTCDASPTPSGGAQYTGTTDKSQTLVWQGPSSTSSRIISDAEDLVEETYSGNGLISGSAYAGGDSLTYTYSTAPIPGSAPTANLLMSISDQFGRTVSFAYEQTNEFVAPRIFSMTGPDGAVTRFGYDAGENLTTITWPDSTVRTFRYGNPNFGWAMTGITDELGQIYSTYGYDAAGLAVSTELAGHANAFSVSYASAPGWEVTSFVTGNGILCRDHHWVSPTGTSVTGPTGSTSSLGASSSSGTTMLSSATTPAGSGSSASSSYNTYDSNGNALSRDDLNGNRTCYAYDTTRNLQLAMLEGLPGGASGKACPASLGGYSPSTSDPTHPERMTTTTWHPDWVLKTREAEPKRITTWVYNGQTDPLTGTTASCASPAVTLPDGKAQAVLCARYEQATSDLTGGQGLSATPVGAVRVWTYTYNQYGQVLTSTTPKQSATDALNHTTTYSYYADTSFSGAVGHTMGDLQSVTNPLGQITTFASYDPVGRLLSSTDANGTVTTQTYFIRGWLKTQTVTPAVGAALTTAYDYWPTGQLKTVTLPDASTLSYAYDAAHRLTDVVDGAGNKLHYTLDAAGNRTSEQVSDASGHLASLVAHVYDALNRVQSTTGAVN